MGFYFIHAAAVNGFTAEIIRVEADISNGLPKFNLVGLPDAAVNEAKERVRAAIKNSNFTYPRTVITVNLAPAQVKKHGPAYDLGIAIAILSASHALKLPSFTQKTLFLGELALDGQVRPVRGTLLCALEAKKAGFSSLVIPNDNAAEASLVKDLKIYPINHLKDIVGDQILNNKAYILKNDNPPIHQTENTINFTNIQGQERAKRALEIAAAGGHNILLCGSPGSGKTLLAKAVPGILPGLSFNEALEATAIHSVAGLLNSNIPLLTTPPFRSPHHSASGSALVGGGNNPRPGEISLAHRGVLFLDELPEFNRSSLENLRQPLEEGQVTISRAAGSHTFPAKFMLIAAMNPCPCGFAFDKEKTCSCSEIQKERYLKKISGPLLERIDLIIDVPRLPLKNFSLKNYSEPSEIIRERVSLARKIATERYKKHNMHTNSELSAQLIQQYCSLSSTDNDFLGQAADRLKLSARSYVRTLKVARTIADLANSEQIMRSHLTEALQYRANLTVT